MKKPLQLLAACTVLACCLPLQAAATRKVTLAVISMADDARYAKRRLELAYPNQPQGRALQGVELAVEDTALELQDAGVELSVRDLVLPSAADLPRALQELKAAQVVHIVADLPEAPLRALVRSGPAMLGDVMVFNASLPEDSLRAEGCAPHLLHTLPSQQMEADALAQFLAVRQWRKLLVLRGTQPADAPLAAAWARALPRHGLEAVQTRAFKLSGEANERDLANVRKLSSEPGYDVVAVLDSDGEFARGVPYATQWPRPVVGAAGLVAQAWHPQWQRYGGSQLNRRFAKLAQRPMQGQDWAAWMAGKAVVAALVDAPQSSVAQQLQRLRSGAVALDGFKGQRLTFRPWDGQLRQPVLLSHGDAVAAMAPLGEWLRAGEALDTLGMDAAQSSCRN
ncbi:MULTISPECIES: branched-chain amino acid ABC transporter substrate-binding protein [Acidovorax]|uniref:ABC transporter, substrate binding protein, PQQ-dependent alcohol dehydrogenase system n=1 Tax=Acidovorax soli TaxID=592050 RepID=A0A1H4ECP4_9BURK|nr:MULTISPECIES: branched-chain amino acid ABC transporter substrate-binding protein [Acidovorax]SEA82350.1 ABC transporter, substrate binding protein, PQQ-dependent alcohol dehydrogenase system [Acidovorax soli]